MIIEHPLQVSYSLTWALIVLNYSEAPNSNILRTYEAILAGSQSIPGRDDDSLPVTLNVYFHQLSFVHLCSY